MFGSAFRLASRLAFAATFVATAGGCAVQSGDADAEKTGGAESDLIRLPSFCLGPITGTPIYRDTGFTPGQDGTNILTVTASLPACAYRTWTSLWVLPRVETITGAPVAMSGNYDVVRLTAGQPLRYTIDGLQPTTVYKANLDLYTIANGQFTQVGTTSDYFTITDGTGDDHARSVIVLHGLKQYDDQRKGLVGRGGAQPDGTRYDALPGELWCSEFYAWVTSIKLSTSSYVQKSVGAVQAYFALIGGDAWDTNKNAIKDGHPGDYMSLGGHHSTMFLAYDAPRDLVFTLEGNVDDKVALSWHSRNEMDGIGKIRSIEIVH